MNQNNLQLRDAGALAGRQILARLIDFATRDTNVVVASVILNNLLRAISSVVLTRLLVPEAFGISGIIASVSFTAAMISDLGFQAFVVRHEKGDSVRFLDTVWTIALLRSAILTAALIALSEPIAAFFAKPELAPMIEASALIFILEGLGSLSLLTAIRKRMILRLSLLELGVMIVQIAVSVLLAILWRNVWAVLTALIAASACKSLLSYAVFPDARRRLAFDPVYARDLWRFARYVTGSSLITLLLMQCDKLILARFMTLDAFGLYILAGNLAAAPMAFTTAYASRVLYPSYAEYWRRGEGDLRAIFYAKRWLPSLLYSFAAGGLIGSAPLLIAILYDHRYAGTAIYLQLLAITPFFALASYSSNETLTATGRIATTFQAGIAKLVWLGVAAPLAWLAEGQLGLVAAIGLMELPSVLFKWARMHRAQLLDLRKELIFIGAGLGGILVGGIGSALLTPLMA
ncbi:MULTISPECIES: oligosaccharide flippase family protein [unclassified Sphingobium]|uniref:oligosaccharide flippase family protein n=1 Tax=unclassified Sphingobium TaxID=2611147 RepID=UPI000A640AB0|nr:MULTISPECIES: oligosaccharide flippase family protein [unclassified Sphingobium]